MLLIDGSQGEGGGQILRTALGLSLVTGTAFRIEKVRAGRAKPGLLRQHLTAVNAATVIGDALVDGVELGSQELVFRPRSVRPGACKGYPSSTSPAATSPSPSSRRETSSAATRPPRDLPPTKTGVSAETSVAICLCALRTVSSRVAAESVECSAPRST